MEQTPQNEPARPWLDKSLRGRAADAARELRRENVARGLLMGMTVRAMATDLGVGIATVSRDTTLIFKRWREEQTDFIDRLKVRQIARLDRLMRTVWVSAVSGDLKSVAQALSLMKHEADLTGLYAPTKVASTTPEGKPAPAGAVLVIGGSEEQFLEGMAKLYAHGQAVQNGVDPVQAYEDFNFEHTDFDQEGEQP